MKITRTIIIAFFITCFTAIGFSQPNFGGNGGSLTPNDAEPTPISGLMFLGIAVGAVFGYRKLKV